MIDLLKAILCAIQTVAAAIGALVVIIVNLIIGALGLLLDGLLLLLPNMPEEPVGPPGGVLGFLNWVVPMGALVSGLAAMILIWLVWLAIRIALKWVKAV
jgi:hypothetical protein